MSNETVTAEMTPMQRVEQGLREAIALLERRRWMPGRRASTTAERDRLATILHGNIPTR